MGYIFVVCKGAGERVICTFLSVIYNKKCMLNFNVYDVGNINLRST